MTALKMYTILLSQFAWKLALKKIEKFAQCELIQQVSDETKFKFRSTSLQNSQCSNYGNLSKL